MLVNVFSALIVFHFVQHPFRKCISCTRKACLTSSTLYIEKRQYRFKFHIIIHIIIRGERFTITQPLFVYLHFLQPSLKWDLPVGFLDHNITFGAQIYLSVDTRSEYIDVVVFDADPSDPIIFYLMLQLL